MGREGAGRVGIQELGREGREEGKGVKWAWIRAGWLRKTRAG